MIAPYKLGRSSVRTTVISTLNEGHYSLLMGQAQYNPIMSNKNNYSTWATMDQREQNYEHTQYLYNHNTKTYASQSWGTYINGDYHSTPTSLYLPDGKIATFINSDHNTEIMMKVSDNSYDISAYSIRSTITQGSPAYMNAVIINNRIYGCFRDNFNKLRVIYSDNFGVNWSSSLVVLEFGDVNDWAYPRYCYTDGNDFIFAVNKRETQGTDQNDYTNLYVFRTSDGVNIRNFSDTVTNDLGVTGALNNTELLDYDLGNLGFVQSLCLLDR